MAAIVSKELERILEDPDKLRAFILDLMKGNTESGLRLILTGQPKREQTSTRGVPSPTE
jgi:hypothetical protein